MRIDLESIDAFDGELYVRALRRVRQWTTLEVAQGAKVSVGRLNAVERGLLAPSDAEKERLAAFFGLSSRVLFRTITAKAAEPAPRAAAPELAKLTK